MESASDSEEYSETELLETGLVFPNCESDDSRHSYASFLCPDDDENPMTTGNSCDGCESDAYCAVSENMPDEATGTRMTMSGYPGYLDLTSDDEIVEEAPETVEIIDDNVEENNNDPNNNMDEIQMNDAEAAAAGPSSVSANDRLLVFPGNRSESPKPGCSKDSQPVPMTREPSNEDLTREMTRHILKLVSKIHRDSVFDALVRRNGVPINELRLWDLLPKNERIDYPEIMECTEEGEIRDNEEEGQNEVNGHHMQVEHAATKGVKRGPDMDISTVQTKKSASYPDLSTISVDESAVSAAENAIPASRVSSTSQPTNCATEVAVNRGAIPKIREEPRNAKRPMSLPIPYKDSGYPCGPNARGSRRPNSPELVRHHKTSAENARDRIKNQIASVHELMLSMARDEKLLVKGKTAIPDKLTTSKTTSQNATSRPAVLKYRVKRSSYTSRPDSAEPQKPKLMAVAPVMMHSVPVLVHSAPNPISLVTTSRQNQQEKEKHQPPAPLPSTAQATQPPRHPEQAHPQNPNRPVCMEMYYKLIDIFPNIDHDYVKNLCPPDCGPGDHDAQMASIVEHLLERGPELPQAPVNRVQAEPEPFTNATADDVYETLLGIFPDADPHYLREFAVRSAGKADSVKTFVEKGLEHRDYPTREQYMARLKITEQQRQYTVGFDVKHYLSIIPDPAKHFMDVKRKCMFQTVGFEFLKSHFSRNRVMTISKVYLQSSYNLSRAADCLTRGGTDLKSKRVGSEMPTEDITLLQEMAYIKHKEAINRYMENVKRAEDEEFRILKSTNQLVECQCCYDSECIVSKCSICGNGHVFCNACVIAGTTAKMSEDQTRIHCFVNCGSEISLSVLQRVLAPTTFSILLKKRQAAEVIEAGLEGLVSCPFCHFASIPPEGDKIFKCLNPECTKESCRLCKELSHVPLKCDEVMKADNARRFIEEKMTQALARKCYKCQRAFFKEEGCNKITCPCGAIMCYLCDEPIKDYKHFRGQGSDNTKLCPLYSDTIRLDAVAVREVAEQARLQLMKQHPNITVDTTSLLPAIPRSRAGPHNDVLNADELPRRAQRVLNMPPP